MKQAGIAVFRVVLGSERVSLGHEREDGRMALYWRLRSVPELAELPVEMRKRVWREARDKARKAGTRMKWGWLVLLGYLAASAVILFGLPLALDLIGVGEVTQQLVVAGCVLALVCTLFTVLRPLEIDWLRPYARDYLTSGS